jgi:hypothetical protein
MKMKTDAGAIPQGSKSAFSNPFVGVPSVVAGHVEVLPTDWRAYAGSRWAYWIAWGSLKILLALLLCGW